MEKNTVWAIILSTAVLIGFMFIQARFYPARQQPQTPAETAEQSVKPDTPVNTAAASQIAEVTGGMESGTVSEQEETYTITTKKVKAVFTNRGGDLVSYELLDHRDSDTGKGIEMADNVSSVNRACSISFGGAENPIINDIFTAKQLDAYTIGFFRKFTVKNTEGTDSSFTLVKQYSFKPDDYAFKLDIMIDGDASSPGLNFKNAAYTLRSSPQIGPHFDRKIDRYESRQFIAFNGEKTKKITLGDKVFKSYDKPVTWAGIGGKYFVELIVPESAQIVADTYYSTAVEVNNYANAQAMIVRRPTDSASVKDTYYLYLGPRNEKDLRAYNVADKNGWGLSGLKLSESLQTSGI
jgi:YidC/Oxa1 family membrane protein insertase